MNLNFKLVDLKDTYNYQIRENSFPSYKNFFANPWKTNGVLRIFPYHGSEEISPEIKDLMICECIRNKFLIKGAIKQQHS